LRWAIAKVTIQFAFIILFLLKDPVRNCWGMSEL